MFNDLILRVYILDDKTNMLADWLSLSVDKYFLRKTKTTSYKHLIMSWLTTNIVKYIKKKDEFFYTI